MRNARGRWRPGPDPDRHVLTRRERRKGYRNASLNVENPWICAYVWRKVRASYRTKRRKGA